VTKLAIVDHGAGNLVSIARALERAGAAAVVVDRPADLVGANGVILPGVGSSGAAMKRLTAAGFARPLVELDVPLLGICVGLQLFFDTAEEDGTSCLGMISGRVERLESTPRLPHIGWNDLQVLRPDPLLVGLEERPTFYFVHSFAPVPSDPKAVVATAEYGGSFVAMVRVGSRVGVQFHPERSGLNGARLLANFVACCREVADVA
jgi:glutamine amidotransferase